MEFGLSGRQAGRRTGRAREKKGDYRWGGLGV